MRSQQAVFGMLVLLTGGPPLWAQSSSTYSMDRLTICSGAAFASSLTYETSAVLGQQSPSGSASMCNAGFHASFGYWSVMGDLPVRIVLSAARSPGDQQQVDLSWSGADEVFAVYRASTPQNLADPANLIRETTSCAATDVPSAKENIVFYTVQPRRPH